MCTELIIITLKLTADNVFKKTAVTVSTFSQGVVLALLLSRPLRHLVGRGGPTNVLCTLKLNYPVHQVSGKLSTSLPGLIYGL